MLAMLGAALAGAGFAAAGAGGVAPENPDFAFYLSAQARTGAVVDPALGAAAGVTDQPGRERAFIYAALRDLARSAGAVPAAEDLIGSLETVRGALPAVIPR